jgi:hypothetical protein
MSTKLLKACALAVVGVGMIAASAGVANAQSGSRLCGWVAVETPIKIGLLYEARKKDASYKKQCSKVISQMNDAIKKDAQLSAMKWTKIDKKDCEHVGKLGLAYTDSKGQSKNDICEKMEAKKAYKVVKQGSAATTFTKM